MVDGIKKAIFKPNPQIKLSYQGLSKKRHEPDPQIKAFPTKMFQVQGWHDHWNG